MQTQLAELYQQFASCSCTLEIAQPASKQGSFDFHKVVLSFGFFLCRPLAWSWLARSYSNEQNLAEIERIFRPQIFPQRSGGINPWKQSLSPPPLRYWSQGFFLGESFFLFVFLAAFQSDWNHAKGEREREREIFKLRELNRSKGTGVFFFYTSGKSHRFQWIWIAFIL